MSARAFTILDAIRDERLFGKAFKDEATWRGWFVFLAALFGIAMLRAEADVFRACTGRSGLPDRPFREAWLVCRRRSGKSFVMALIAVFLACFRDSRPFLAAGERATIMVVAADRRQARVVLRFVRGLLSAPVLAKRGVNDVSDAIELQGDVVIEVITASHAVRGYALGAALVDELAFFPSDDASVSGAEIIAAIRPAMATIPDGLLICASSPYARTGALWDAYRKHYGKDEARGRPSRTRSPRRRRELGFGGLGLLDRDHPLVADLFRRVADDLANRLVAVGRDRADLGDLVGGLHLAGAPTGGLRSRRLSGEPWARSARRISCAAWRSNSEKA